MCNAHFSCAAATDSVILGSCKHNNAGHLCFNKLLIVMKNDKIANRSMKGVQSGKDLSSDLGLECFSYGNLCF